MRLLLDILHRPAEATFIGLFCFWRFTLGFGIGGDYPLSAVITSEYSSKHFRGTLIAAVFSMQVRCGCRWMATAQQAPAGVGGCASVIESSIGGH